MNLSDDFFGLVETLMRKAREVNRDALREAGAALAASVAAEGVLHVFGSGHSQIVAREVVNRAGGLVPVSQIVDPTGGWAEVLPGYGEKLFQRYAQQYAPRAGDVALVVSNSGVNPSPVGMALACRDAGMRVVTLSNVALSSKSASKHASGKRLFECGDWALDNCGVPGDAALDIPGQDLKTGAVSTFPGAMLMNLLVLEAIGAMRAAGQEVPILQSANTPGGRERNDAISARYRGRICRPV
ncbi:MAG: sugar isomerase domain-containing protein [Opitutales bacterium]|jgi:uncharacterized phosphosugar-binding protein